MARRFRRFKGSGGGGGVSLPVIGFSGSSVNENVATDYPIGALSLGGAYTGSPTWVLVAHDGNRVKLTAANILAGTTNIDYETHPLITFTVGVTGVDPLPNNTNFNVTVNNLDEVAPTITSTNTISLAENSALSHTLTADETVTWTKTGGADTALFTLAGNNLSLTAKDYDSPIDSGSNNTYVVQVTATDAAGNATNQTVTVTITNIDEVAPTITSSASVSQVEGVTLNHALTANETVTWTKTGGADASLFSLAGSTLTLISKDYDAPVDSGANNTYIVQVTATDTASNATNQTITVTITPEEVEATLITPTLDLHADADSGSSSVDNITNIDDLIFTCTDLIDGATLHLMRNGVEVGSATATGAEFTISYTAPESDDAEYTVWQELGAEFSLESSIETVTVDLTAPAITSVTNTETGETTADIGFTTDEACTYYYVVDANTTTPSAAQVIAGQNAASAAADADGSSSVAVGPETVGVTGLVAGTTYKTFVVGVDVAGNISTVGVASGTFTTDAAAGSVAGTAFLARTTGLPTKYSDAYTDLFSSLTTAGFFDAGTGASTIFDGFWIAKTYNEATAALDLTAEENDLAEIGTVSFTADVGWINTAGSGEGLNTGINPYGRGGSGGRWQNGSAHMMTWNATNSEDVYTAAMGAVGGGAGQASFFCKDVFGHGFSSRLNSLTLTDSGTLSDPTGMLVSTRTGTTHKLYKNTSELTSGSAALDSMPNVNVYLLCQNNNGTLDGETLREHWAWSVGAYIDSTKRDALYAALAQFWVDIA